ncbi:hypothetical protein [Neobacillus mesonae]|uniref:hypothetical protein n=1 Tax=Neobacillus mesonae TaxID=1193713 RepID=UPI002E203DE1|nr:hypothetical protein [Neobacillus mesonae]
MFRRQILLGLAAIFAVIGAAGYWFYFSPPLSFPNNKQLISEINRLFPEAKVSTIQDSIEVDEKRVVVPFISKDDHYGASYWVWRFHKWQAVYIDTMGQPHVWKIDRKDPSSYYFVWNIHPRHQLKNIKFYYLRNRNYTVMDGKEFYKSGIQMEKDVSFEGNDYGVLRLPEEWAASIKSIMKVDAAAQSDLFFQPADPVGMYFAWTPFGKNGKEKFTEEGIVSGNGYTNGTEDIEYIMVVSEEELQHR